jgi:uncharacterized protein
MKNVYYFAFGALLTVAFLAAIGSRQPNAVPQPDGGKKKSHKMVIQMTTPDTLAYRALTRQINNVLDKWPDARIEVVAHNKGIGLLTKERSNVAEPLAALQAKGIQFFACEQTLKQLKMAKTDILPLAGFVERGLVHVVERQEEGWAYIKGGF